MMNKIELNTKFKNITIFLLVAFAPTLLLAQPTKKIFDPKTHEAYHVLKSDQSIRQGNYRKRNENGKTVITGYYKNGVKDSIWQFFDSEGDLQQKYDFTKNELVYYSANKINPENKFRVIDGSNVKELKLDRPPIYIGGDAVMFESIAASIEYPYEATKNGISGTVYVIFNLDKNGKSINRRILKGVGYGCDDEALRVVKGIPDNWLPGIYNGQAVEVEMVMPIQFMIQR